MTRWSGERNTASTSLLLVLQSGMSEIGCTKFSVQHYWHGSSVWVLIVVVWPANFLAWSWHTIVYAPSATGKREYVPSVDRWARLWTSEGVIHISNAIGIFEGPFPFIVFCSRNSLVTNVLLKKKWQVKIRRFGRGCWEGYYWWRGHSVTLLRSVCEREREWDGEEHFSNHSRVV
mgnify:CR=1 FL=1